MLVSLTAPDVAFAGGAPAVVRRHGGGTRTHIAQHLAGDSRGRRVATTEDTR